MKSKLHDAMLSQLHLDVRVTITYSFAAGNEYPWAVDVHRLPAGPLYRAIAPTPGGALDMALAQAGIVNPLTWRIPEEHE